MRYHAIHPVNEPSANCLRNPGARFIRVVADPKSALCAASSLLALSPSDPTLSVDPIRDKTDDMASAKVSCIAFPRAQRPICWQFPLHISSGSPLSVRHAQRQSQLLLLLFWSLGSINCGPGDAGSALLPGSCCR